MHNFLIILHAVSGAVGLCTGVVVLLNPRDHTSGWFRSYYWSIVAMVAFVIAAVGYDWQRLGAVQRPAFGALVILALYTARRAHQARQAVRRRTVDWPSAYRDHVGFTVIALFDGFVIVGAIDVTAPVWLVAVLGVIGVAGGIQAVKAAKRRPVAMISPT
ncbi:hypothetical protein [Streptomyces sp. NPDC004721]